VRLSLQYGLLSIIDLCLCNIVTLSANAFAVYANKTCIMKTFILTLLLHQKPTGFSDFHSSFQQMRNGRTVLSFGDRSVVEIGKRPHFPLGELW